AAATGDEERIHVVANVAETSLRNDRDARGRLDRAGGWSDNLDGVREVAAKSALDEQPRRTPEYFKRTGDVEHLHVGKRDEEDEADPSRPNCGAAKAER